MRMGVLQQAWLQLRETAADTRVGMQYDFADILVTVVERNASDLHITPGVPPMLRIRGSLAPMDGLPRLTPTDTREIVYSILSNSQRQRLETDQQLDFSYSVP